MQCSLGQEPSRTHLHTQEPLQGLLRYSPFTDGVSTPGQVPRKALEKKDLGRSFWAMSPARGCSAPFLGLHRHDAGKMPGDAHRPHWGPRLPLALAQVPQLCPRTVPKGRPHEGATCAAVLWGLGAGLEPGQGFLGLQPQALPASSPARPSHTMPTNLVNPGPPL